MLHSIAVWLLVVAFVGAGLFNAIDRALSMSERPCLDGSGRPRRLQGTAYIGRELPVDRFGAHFSCPSPPATTGLVNTASGNAGDTLSAKLDQCRRPPY